MITMSLAQVWVILNVTLTPVIVAPAGNVTGKLFVTPVAELSGTATVRAPEWTVTGVPATTVPPPLIVAKFTGVVLAPLQITWSSTVFTWPTGFTVMVNVRGVPVQVTPALVKLGVTVTVPLIGAFVVLVGVKLKLPVPLAGKPIAVLVFVQLYTEPVALPLKATVEAAPAQNVWLAIAFTVAVGLTV